MKHNEDGRNAEEAVSLHLKKCGYKIIDRNWKTKSCEVDIVAQKNECVYFVEVKYRSTASQGSGFDYITPSKLRQMEYAARYWVETTKYGGEYVLSAAEVSGPNFIVEFLEEI